MKRATSAVVCLFIANARPARPARPDCCAAHRRFFARRLRTFP